MVGLEVLHFELRKRYVRWGLWVGISEGEGEEKSCKDEESVELHDEDLWPCKFSESKYSMQMYNGVTSYNSGNRTT